MNLDALQELCTALTASALEDEDAALSATDFLKVCACSSHLLTTYNVFAVGPDMRRSRLPRATNVTQIMMNLCCHMLWV